MSERRRLPDRQLDLFRTVSVPSCEPKSIYALDQLRGLVVSLPDTSRCGTNTVRIGVPVGPHCAELRCTSCETHRGWLPRAAHQFLTEIVNKFGRPTTPITIRRGGAQREQD